MNLRIPFLAAALALLAAPASALHLRRTGQVRRQPGSRFHYLGFRPAAVPTGQ